MFRSCFLRGLLAVLTGGVLLARPAGAADDLPWSFRPVAKPAVPAVKDAAWSRDPLDPFILSRVEAAGLSPNPDADRRTLIRRATFDLTGLPPTPAEVEAFAADPAPLDAAFAKVVDRLLASPRFGERWGRHWLDVARYADSVGRSWNAPFNYAFRYRDWVIDSFNADKPYNLFVIEQLAGDLLPAKTPAAERDQRTGTGFLAVGAISIQEGSREQLHLDRADDQIDATTRAFLGLTVACARCHDHKTDPISTKDYYALAGVFLSTRTLPGTGCRADGHLNYVDATLLVRVPGKDGKPGKPVPGIHTMSDFMDVARTGAKEIRYDFDPNLVMGVAEGEVRNTEVRKKGTPYDRGAEQPRGVGNIEGLPKGPAVPAAASGRHELANWIASAENPLTARVFVNRVWQHLFGRGIVRTVDDFGSTGEAPTHPELLDHLAARFVADGWSMKKLIRGIVLSRTYRLSSVGSKASKEIDPQNDLYWRSNLRRLELEPLRDSLLMAAGRLTFERPDGVQMTGTGGKGRNGVVRSLLPLESPYRTVYLPVLRALTPDAYGTFDFPDPCQITGLREVTTVAPQALFFLNGDLATDCARRAAGLLLKDAAADDARVKLAYQRLLGRPPVADEVSDANALVKGVSGDETYRWAVLVQAMTASAEFRYVR